MSKERLEEIKKHRDEAENSIDEYEFEKINFYNLHVDWLIEQAERVEELEKVEYALQETYRQEREYNKKLEQQNKRYREALSIISANLPLDEREHYVYIARQALEGET